MNQEIEKDRPFKTRLKDLRTGILEMQEYLKQERISTLIIVTGFDGAGKGHIIQRFNEWLDPRTVSTSAFWISSDEERERPYFWKFWRYLPSKGRTALFFGSWYADLIAQRLYDGLSDEKLDQRLEKIRFFERMLAEDGTLIMKYWLHLARDQQLEKKAELEKNPQFHWKMQPDDWSHEGHYERFLETAEYVMGLTDQECSRWTRVPAFDPDERDYMVARSFVRNVQRYSSDHARLRKSNQAPPPAPFSPSEPLLPVSTPSLNPPDDQNLKLDKAIYNELLPDLQDRLFQLAWTFYHLKKSVFLVFEGWDAAGKGGCIRRVVDSIDARLFDVIPISAPTREELDYNYLWRFWKTIPRAGRMAIYDRSWYGRVLVERVEGFARDHEWMRAYNEIIDFENQLTRPGNIVLKFWLEISPETQLKRFQKRQVVPFKRFKLGPEDWRNRAKWSNYQIAAREMIEKTHTPQAPWHVIHADNKRFGRIDVLKRIVATMESALADVDVTAGGQQNRA